MTSGAVALSVFLVAPVQAADFCVSNTTELHDALTTAAGNGEDDTIQVVQGTYNGGFTYSSSGGNSITLIGGYISGCAIRRVDPANTVLDGGATDRVLYLYNSNGGDITLDGFTLQNGSTTYKGGGVWAESVTDSDLGFSGNITITNNIITGNTAPGGGGGGGVCAISVADLGTAGNIKLTSNTITNNSTNAGGGAYVASSSSSGTAGNLTLINNTISGNIASYDGGGVYGYSSSTSSTAGNVVFINNIITDNTSESSGGGINANSYTNTGTAGNATFTNNTISGNTAAAMGGGLFYVNWGQTIDVYNNIIWGNTPKDMSLLGTGSFNGNNNNSSSHPSWTNSGDNIDTDPRFVAPNNGNYHLRPISPCIDTGTNSAPWLPATDFEADTRVTDGDDDGVATVDIGADEFVADEFPWELFIPAILKSKQKN
jgi:hypothetical protein